jgi:DNA-directed RNA polymerase
MARYILKEDQFIFETINDFERAIEEGDFEISKIIVETILSNLNTKKKNIYVMNFYIEETEESIDFTVLRSNFSEVLEKNLKFYEKEELYEMCSVIQKTIKLLK